MHHDLTPGTLQTDGKTYLRVAASDGFVGIRSLQLPGKKRLPVEESCAGCGTWPDTWNSTLFPQDKKK